MGNSLDVDPSKVLTDVSAAIAKDALLSGWNKVKGFFKDLTAETSMRYRGAYENYLANAQDKNRKIKTLIYRRVPKDLYSFYECIGVEYDGKTISTKSISNLFAVGSNIIITGTGGIGKTIMLKHLFLNTAETTNYIPVLIELRKFNMVETKEISLYKVIYQTLHENGFDLEEKYFESSLKAGAYVILLDGFDEINRDKVDCMTSEIKQLSNEYHENKFIVSSRPADSFIGWNNFAEMTALPLTKQQALDLISKIEFDESVKNTFYQALDKTLFDKYESFASNPLLLTIMLLTFNNHASIPEKLNDFYEEAFSTLFNMHDATKDCYVRDIRTNLGCEDFKTVFAYICFKSYFAGEFEFSESSLREYIQSAKNKFTTLRFSVDDFQEDLTLSVCMLIKDGLNYRFSHRSFQEYFAAWYTCKITDEAQFKLLSAWMGESSAATTDEYLTMLFNLQSEKVNKIIFCPGIAKIKILYDELGFSCELLKTLFSGIRIQQHTTENKDSYYQVSLVIKDHYLCNIMIMTCRLNKYSYSIGKDPSEDILARKIKYVSQKKRKRQWDIDEVLQLVSPQELLNGVSWFDRQYRFCLDILQKNTMHTVSYKRKVASILNEL